MVCERKKISEEPLKIFPPALFESCKIKLNFFYEGIQFLYDGNNLDAINWNFGNSSDI